MPLTVSIRNRSAWWSVATKEVSLIVVIDRERVIKLFASRGLLATWDHYDRPHVGPGWSLRSTSLPEGRPFQVAHQYFGRVGEEFLSLAWFVQEITARFAREATAAAEVRSEDRTPLLAFAPTPSAHDAGDG